MDRKGMVFVVTGAAGGVGRQLVLRLLDEGACVAAVDVQEAALQALGKDLPGMAARLSLHRCDITEGAGVNLLAGEVKGRWGHVDGLINNAGIIQPFTGLADLDPQVADRLWDVNFKGMFHMCRAFIPLLAARPEAWLGNVASMGGFLPVPGQTMYGASKAAVKIASEGLRMELAGTGIHVSTIIPGGIETDIKKNSGLGADEEAKGKESAGFPLTKPEEAARIILDGMAKGKAKILVGKDARIMDILYRLAPARAADLIGKVMQKNHGGIFYRMPVQA